MSVLCVSLRCSVEGDASGGEVGASVDPSGYGCIPVAHSSELGRDHLDNQLYGHILLPGHPRPRRPKLQHSQSILRKQAEEEAIKRSRSLSESYELSSDLQDKQVSHCHGWGLMPAFLAGKHLHGTVSLSECPLMPPYPSLVRLRVSL